LDFFEKDRKSMGFVAHIAMGDARCWWIGVPSGLQFEGLSHISFPEGDKYVSAGQSPALLNWRTLFYNIPATFLI